MKAIRKDKVDKDEKIANNYLADNYYSLFINFLLLLLIVIIIIQ